MPIVEPDRSGNGVFLHLHVQPGASRGGVVGRHGDALKLKVAAPPVDGKANAAVVQAVAELLGVPPGRVRVVGGHASRAKRVAVDGVDPAAAIAAVDEALATRHTSRR